MTLEPADATGSCSRVAGHLASVAGSACSRLSGAVAHRSKISLYLAIDLRKREADLRTGWLPKVPEIDGPMTRAGYERHEFDGNFRANVPIADELRVRRAIKTAFEVMLREAEG
jgi:hypothetical protein